MSSPPWQVIAVLGPTATGKSAFAMALAVDLAERGLTVELISADALQAYRGLTIGTAKPGPRERSRVRHHLIDVIEPHQAFSAGAFARRAAVAVEEIEARGALPVLVGGSGFYLRALFEGLAPVPPVGAEVREALRADLRSHGLCRLVRELREVDPQGAETLAPGDTQRVLRALEVVKATGRPLSEWQRRGTEGRLDRGLLKVGLTLPRTVLYDAVEKRARRMLERGWLAEVERLREHARGRGGCSLGELPAFQAIGYRQLADHLEGNLTLEAGLGGNGPGDAPLRQATGDVVPEGVAGLLDRRGGNRRNGAGADADRRSADRRQDVRGGAVSAARRMAAMLVACLWGVACVTTAIVEAPPEVTELDNGIRSFLREPLLGYEGNIPEQSRYELAGASAALRRGEVEVARTSAETLLGIDPTLLPASVLLAQSHFAAGENVLAVDLLVAPLAARPDYTAGQLVYARAAERTGDAVAAYRAYRGIAAVDEVAAERAAALEDEAIAELSDRIAAAIDGGGLADAGTALETLRVWAPGYPVALDLGRRLALARGDTGAELAATRELVAAGNDSLEVLHRQAALELEAGDARRGLELYEELAQRHPGNSEIAAGLAAARFTWRTRLLPESVRELFEASSLLRADFAALTAWLVPGIRTGPAGSTVIVSDILEHPPSSRDRAAPQPGSDGAGGRGGASLRAEQLHAARSGTGHAAPDAGPGRRRCGLRRRGGRAGRGRRGRRV